MNRLELNLTKLLHEWKTNNGDDEKTAVLSKIAVEAFERCQISPLEIIIFEESFELFPLKFSYFLDRIAN